MGLFCTSGAQNIPVYSTGYIYSKIKLSFIDIRFRISPLMEMKSGFSAGEVSYE